jgi:hypothetical protein
MLTDKELSFIAHFKLTGNATESYLNAGYKVKPLSARVMACKLLKRPDIAEIVSRAQVNQVNQIVNAPVNIPKPPKQFMKMPSKEEYIIKAWERTEDTDSSKKEETRAKYFELTGKAMGIFQENCGGNTQILIYNEDSASPRINSEVKILDLIAKKSLNAPNSPENPKENPNC